MAAAGGGGAAHHDAPVRGRGMAAAGDGAGGDGWRVRRAGGRSMLRPYGIRATRRGRPDPYARTICTSRATNGSNNAASVAVSTIRPLISVMPTTV